MNWLWDNINLKRDERDRYIYLTGILLCLILLKLFMVKVYEPIGFEVDPIVLDSVKMVSLKQKEFKPYSKKKRETQEANYTKDKANYKPTTPKKKIKPIIQSFRFNPNTISKDSLNMLGLSKYAINSMLKYRSKGGVFRSVNQIEKVNGIDAETMQRILPLVDLPQKEKYTSYEKKEKQLKKESKPKYPKYEKKKPEIIEINTADTTAFRNLYGIGRVYSNRIVKYRNSLGGFFSIEQIKDVWGISDSLYLTLVPYLQIDVDAIKKININTLDKKGLEKHPYIDWRKSKAIIAYRDTHGDYKEMDELYKLYGIEKEFVDTLKIYFDVK